MIVPGRRPDDRVTLVGDLDHPVEAFGLVGIGIEHAAEDRRFEVDELDVVILVEDVVDGRQAEVFVGAAVAGDVVVADRFEQELARRRRGSPGRSWPRSSDAVVAKLTHGAHSAAP